MSLRTTYGNKASSSNGLLEKDNFVLIHHINMQALAMEMYKLSNNMSPTILNSYFCFKGYPL